MDDIVHDALLGVRLTRCGSAMRDMADMQWWAPEVPGPWVVKLNHQLHHAYAAFKKWCLKHQMEHSGTPCKASTLSMSSLTSWPELKIKANNCATVTLWLASELQARLCDSPIMRALFTMWGFAARYCIWSGAEQQLSDHEVQSLKTARSAALEGYHWLSLNASQTNRYAYLLRPKFHKLDDCVRKAIKTRRNPAWFWSFADESWVGAISKLSGSAHNRCLAQRVPSRWLAIFVLELLEGACE